MTITCDTTVLPDGYRPLDFEKAPFAEQDALNLAVDTLLAGGVAPATVATIVRMSADERHAQHPQYDGHWDGPQWRLVRFTRHVVTKGGCRFAAGDYTIADLTPNPLPAVPQPYVTAYSVRGYVNCSVARTDFTEVA
jgi:hypothetical protein